MVLGSIRKNFSTPSEEDGLQERAMVAVSKFPNLPITLIRKTTQKNHCKRNLRDSLHSSLPGFLPHKVGDLVLYTDIHLKCAHLWVELRQPSTREPNTRWCLGAGERVMWRSIGNAFKSYFLQSLKGFKVFLAGDGRGDWEDSRSKGEMPRHPRLHETMGVEWGVS